MLPHSRILAGYFIWCHWPSDELNNLPRLPDLPRGRTDVKLVCPLLSSPRVVNRPCNPGPADDCEKWVLFLTLFFCIGCGAWPTTPWSPAVTWRKQFAVWPSAPMDLSWPWAWRMALSLCSESGTYQYGKWCQKCSLVETSSPGQAVCQDFRKKAFK